MSRGGRARERSGVDRRAPGLALEIAAWNEIDTRFAQQAALVDAIAGIDRELAGHDTRRTALAATRKSAAAEHQTAVAKLGEAQRKAATYQQRRGLTLDAARRQEEQARTKLVEVERLVAIASGARQAMTARDALDRQIAELDQAQAVELAARDQLEASRTVATALRAERARVVDELRRAAGYEHAARQSCARARPARCAAPRSIRGATAARSTT